ncbi:MAG: hypothetical protein ABSC33_17055 [Candidatus Sulfotelmatobacter sp.]|jgi:hypothetical protein
MKAEPEMFVMVNSAQSARYSKKLARYSPDQQRSASWHFDPKIFHPKMASQDLSFVA